MKVIVAGSRDIVDYEIVKSAIVSSGFQINEIVSGGARGVDTLGERYAKENNILFVVFPANWDLYGKKAGYLRNAEMAKYANGLIAVWDGVSKGTGHMIDLAQKNNLQVYIHRI
jgi:hypothetical protein